MAIALKAIVLTGTGSSNLSSTAFSLDSTRVVHWAAEYSVGSTDEWRFESSSKGKMVKRREGMHGESSYGVRTPEKCVFSGSNPDLTTHAGDNERRKQPFSHNIGHFKGTKYRLHTYKTQNKGRLGVNTPCKDSLDGYYHGCALRDSNIVKFL